MIRPRNNSPLRGPIDRRRQPADPPLDYGLGIDLGGSSVKAVAITPDGRVLRRRQKRITDFGNMEWIEPIQILAREMEQGSPPRFLGISVPGLISPDGWSVAHMPGRLQGLEGLNWSQVLRTARPVPVINDGQAALLGEAWIGAARGLQNALLLTLGTGVGGALLVDGRVLRGHIGRAGHLGHSCLDPKGPRDVTGVPGSLEWFMGNASIRERCQGRFSTTHELVAASQAGDSQARAVWLDSVHKLACALCSFINITDPEVVIIGGGIARSGRALLHPLQKYLDDLEWRPGGRQVKLRRARLGEFAGAIGAARHALNQMPQPKSSPHHATRL